MTQSRIDAFTVSRTSGLTERAHRLSIAIVISWHPPDMRAHRFLSQFAFLAVGSLQFSENTREILGCV